MDNDFYNASDFLKKTVFRKSRIVGKLALKQSFSRSFYTLKTSKLAFLSILGKVVPEKVLLNKKAFRIEFFKFNQFLNHIVYHASYFESRSSNASDFEPFFHNSTKLESKKLDRVTFRKKVLQRIRFWREMDLYKHRTWWMFCFQKINFWSFTPWKRQFLQLCAFSKSTSWWKRWKKKQFSHQDFWKNQILKQFFNSASDFESRNSKYVRILVKSTQIVIFWIGILTTCRILKHPFYHTSDLEQKF